LPALSCASILQDSRKCGSRDSAFYYTVAKKHRDGRGPVIDYIVYFSADYCRFHITRVISGIQRIVSDRNPDDILWQNNFQRAHCTIAAALFRQLPDIQQANIFRSIKIGALTGILTFFSPFRLVSTTTEAIIFAGAFGQSRLFMMKGLKEPHYFFLAAIFTGLAKFDSTGRYSFVSHAGNMHLVDIHNLEK